MTSIYLLAHCDDEYAAWPLLRADQRAGRQVRIFHLTAPANEHMARRRQAESLVFLDRLGIAPDDIVEIGARDGYLIDHLDASLDALRADLAAGGPPTTITVTAWEGGHADHDACAALAVALAEDLTPAPALRQFSLYHGEGLASLLFRTGPLPGGGASERVRLSLSDWLDFALAARAFPSQTGVFITWWPSLFGAYLSGGYRVQALTPERVRERPHAGALLYERRRRGDYASVAERVAALLRT